MELSKKHLKTIAKIRKRPRTGNLKYPDLESALEAMGFERFSNKSGGVAFNKGDNLTFTYHRPHPRPDVDKGAINALDKFLEREGIYEDFDL